MRSILAPLQTLTVYVVIKISKCSEKARWQTLLKDGLRRPNQVFMITQSELVRLICESSAYLTNSLQIVHELPIFAHKLRWSCRRPHLIASCNLLYTLTIETVAEITSSLR